MSASTSGLLRFTSNGTAPGRGLVFWCPGCQRQHRIVVDAPNAWTWDGNEGAPTVSPSILVHSHKTLDNEGQVTDTPTCHSFVVAGQWQFLGDCTHALAGQTVPMVPLPDWLSDRDD